MRKETSPREFCDKCGGTTRHATEDVFCDVCDTKIEKQSEELRMTVFFNSRSDIDTKDLDLCSWQCVFKAVKNKMWGKKKVNFINLPNPSDSRGDFNADLKDFLDAAKNSLGYLIRPTIS
jgi:hypothetical protein